ncbi:MAG TPA: glycosyltransferase family 9 protein [Vicinamibacterales bacterium]|nr:glycosyltransferase family 9 protein [Vicinamibacterales bacterium]
MDISFQRAVDRYVGVPICALFSLIDGLLPTAQPRVPPRRILVILLSEMGSQVLAHEMFARLKQKYPAASIHALVFTKNREVLDLLAVMPPENVLTVSDQSLTEFVGDALNVVREMRKLAFDVVIDCELFARVSSIFSFLSGAPVRVGFFRHTQEGLYRGTFINRQVMYNPYTHLTQQFVGLVEAIDSRTIPVAKDAALPALEAPPLLQFPADELEQVFSRLDADFPGVKGKSLVLVSPSGGILPIRAWPIEHYRELCMNLLADGHAVAIVGLQGDKRFGEDLVAHCRSPHCVDLTGYTKSVRHLLALFHRASLLVTNDGGPGQFAAVTPVPTIILFGPETPALYGTLSKNSHCFHLALPCSPCLTAYNHRNSPCDGDNQCLKRITPEQVLAKARQMMTSEPAWRT